jgi:DMSO/TMAO reductase YedYZ molybdopterin-dependent catalytic subunit
MVEMSGESAATSSCVTDCRSKLSHPVPCWLVLRSLRSMPFTAAITVRFPTLPRDEWRLTVDGMVANSRTLTYDHLVTSFTAYSVVATLACAGNRRAELLNVRAIPGRDPWARGDLDRRMAWSEAFRCPRVGGVPDDDGLHVAFGAPDVAAEAVPVQSNYLALFRV